MNKFLGFIIIFLILLTGCKKKQKVVEAIKFPVTVTDVIKKDSPIYVDSIGHVVSFIKVDIRSRVEGEIKSIHFTEGNDVKKGDLLFVIDPKNYIEDLKKAEATLKENEANLSFAQDRLKRNKSLYTKEYISEIQFDQLITDVKKYEAIVDQNIADVKNAKINLDYCYIKAPINGRVSILNIDQGNLISPNENTPLATITQISPIYVQFTVPEKYLLAIKSYQEKKPLKVLSSYDGFKSEVVGNLKIINNEIDEMTGSIKLKAIYENENKVLTPGQFISSKLVLDIKKDALLVPFQSVQITGEGPILYVVKNDIAMLKKVKLGQRENLNIIIEKGIEEGEKVVVKGQINLTDNAKVFEAKD